MLKPKSSRLSGILVVGALVCAGVYTFAMRGLQSGNDVGSLQTGGAVNSVHQNTATTPDVPNRVLQEITVDVAGVQGVDEVFVNPDTAGGYNVSGTVNVSVGATQNQVDQAVAGFLRGAYSSRLDVKDVQVYIFQQGNIIAGAGLGINVYKQLTSTAGVSAFSLVSALQSSDNNVQGADDKWFQSQVPGSP